MISKFLFLLFFFMLLTLTSCSSFVDGMYRDLDRQERANADADTENQNRNIDQFDQYRKNTKRRTSSVYNKPGRQREDVSTSTQNNVDPSVKRQYQDGKVALKRTTASDLTDNGTDGSLWTSNDPNAFLFTNSKNKNAGDIVQINVLPRLKNEITMELKRAFPDNPYEAKAEDLKKKPGAAAPPASLDAATNPSDNNSSGPQDKISGVVVEEINREHLLIKGRKNVLFKNRKRLVEVQALVSRKDITEDDSVSSDTILETNVSVVR